MAADGDLKAAAEIIADGARRMAVWSRQIPARISVSGSGDSAEISCDAPPAYPGETRASHPLFGNRRDWYGPPGEPFLGPATDARVDAAAARYARKVDGWLKEDGFR